MPSEADLVPATATLQISPNSKTSTVAVRSSSLAAHVHRRLTTPLAYATLRHCHQKFVQTTETTFLRHLVDSSSTVELFSNSDATSLFDGNETIHCGLTAANEQLQLMPANTAAASLKRIEKNNKTNTTKSTTKSPTKETETALEKSTPLSAAGGRRRRKRGMSRFLRRSTSHFTTTNAPG